MLPSLKGCYEQIYLSPSFANKILFSFLYITSLVLHIFPFGCISACFDPLSDSFVSRGLSSLLVLILWAIHSSLEVSVRCLFWSFERFIRLSRSEFVACFDPLSDSFVSRGLSSLLVLILWAIHSSIEVWVRCLFWSFERFIRLSRSQFVACFDPLSDSFVSRGLSSLLVLIL